MRNSWTHPIKQSATRKLVLVMTVSLVIKVSVTAFLIWTFLKIEPRVLLLYLLYRILVYLAGHWSIWWRRWINHAGVFPRSRLGES